MINGLLLQEEKSSIVKEKDVEIQGLKVGHTIYKVLL